MIRTLLSRLLLVVALFGIAPLASAQSDYTKTRYPIVLVHGLLGFDSLFGVYDYWYGVPSDLRAGGAKVFIGSVSASNYTEVRGEQLIRHVDVRSGQGIHERTFARSVPANNPDDFPPTNVERHILHRPERVISRGRLPSATEEALHQLKRSADYIRDRVTQRRIPLRLPADTILFPKSLNPNCQISHTFHTLSEKVTSIRRK